MEKRQSKADNDLIKAVKHRIKADGAGLVARAIKAGANVNVKDSRGDPVLVSAVENENIDMVKELVKAGADVNADNRYGYPVLVSAVKTKNIDMVKELVKAGAVGGAEDWRWNPVLVSAVETKNIDIVKELVKAGVDVNDKNENGDPILMSAVKTKNMDIIQELVKAGAVANAEDWRWKEVLVSAVETKNIDMVKELVKAGAVRNAEYWSWNPVLESAVKTKNIDIVKELVKAGVGVNAKYQFWDPVLVSAIETKDIDMVKELVKAGADVNAKNRSGDPVLVSALMTTNMDIIKELVMAGADVNAQDRNGDPVLVSAVVTTNIDILHELVKAGAVANAEDWRWKEVFVSAVETKNIDMVKELVKAGAVRNAEYWRWNPVLESAVKTKNIDIVKELVKAGVDMNAKDQFRDPVLVSAIETNDIDIVKELVKAGADVNAKNRSGDPVLVTALMTTNIDMVKELVKAGADVNAKNQSGDPVLVTALMTTNIDNVKELVMAGADVNAQDRNGDPVLVSALGIRLENNIMVKELVKAGADVNVMNTHGYPVLALALWYATIDMVKELVKAGADVNVKDQYGNPVLTSAVVNENTDAVKELVKAGADVNVIITSPTGQSIVRPLHIAVAYPAVEIFKNLVNSGACINYDDQGEVSALHLVSVETNPDILRELYDNEKNSNARGKYNRSYLHYAASLGSYQQIKNVLSLSEINVNLKDDFGNSPLHCAVQIGNLETIRALITAGCDREAVDSSGRTLLHLAAIYGHSDLVDIFIDEYGLNPLKLDNEKENCLHYAVIFRQEDFVGALLQRDAESLKEYKTKDSSGKTPSDYLHSCEKNSLILKFLKGESVEIQIVPLKNSQTTAPDISNAILINISEISKEPSIGLVATITGHDNEMFVKYVKYVKDEVQRVILEAVPISEGRDDGLVVGCGSSFEGTKTGLPDEFDFLVKLDTEFSTRGHGQHEGYGRMFKEPLTGSFGLWLWDRLMSFWSECQANGKTSHSDGQRSMKMPLPPQRHPDRKTCTTWIWLYSDEMFTDLPVSIDFVPAVEVCLRYGETRGRPTGLIREDKIMKNRKLYFVPKIPNEKSKMTEKFENYNLHQLGRVSYPTLEVEHIQDLEDRVKDVYITAKCVRYVEVCGFKVENDEGDTKSVSELVTSYRLKSVFLHLVELFRKSDMSLGKMVLMVYEQLEKCLERGHLPMFFDPEINVLAGSKLSTEESLQVTRMMTRFVRSLYERDFSPEPRARDAAEEERVLEEERVAYDERRREYEKEQDELSARGGFHAYFELNKLLAPFLPIYLTQPSPNSEQD